jgi:hypothetical protein
MVQLNVVGDVGRVRVDAVRMTQGLTLVRVSA